ncbi:protein kinase domain-containing protein [Niallia nealsonii]|uniref:Serine/threonine protein kinase n=1 Tax=Niallia nealsonii TaxID=115979 RepID=A0A2N0YZ07_9BACI|nr:serine/threonine-protein kinase [Niallia nealsonii]PKG22489.1 serine/threonine protein kinase [Niallia nealsonii]
MMMNTSKSPFRIHSGTVIKGKWHGNNYTILKELGFGANGTVFLAECKLGQFALKISDNGLSIISEVNVLKSFAKVQGYSLGPSLVDVDDWVTGRGTISFYVMEYIKGPELLTFISQKESSWINVLMIQLLKDLQVLHDNNWVFGDLKPENLIITGPPTRIRCIDVGGTTIRGRAIKEFTEFFDRGYWGLGTRKAEPSYDLFAVGMVIMNIAYPKRFNKTTGGIAQLKAMIQQKKELRPFENVLMQAFMGKYSNANEMKQALLQLSSGSKVMKNTIDTSSANQVKSQTATPKQKTATNQNTRSRQLVKKRKRKTGVLESLLLILIISLLYFFYIYGQLT